MSLYSHLDQMSRAEGCKLEEIAAAFRHGCEPEILAIESNRSGADLASKILDRGNQVLHAAAKGKVASTRSPGQHDACLGGNQFWQSPPDVVPLLMLDVHGPGCSSTLASRDRRRACTLPNRAHQTTLAPQRMQPGSKAKGKSGASTELAHSLQSSVAYLLEVLAAAQHAGGQVRMMRGSWWRSTLTRTVVLLPL